MNDAIATFEPNEVESARAMAKLLLESALPVQHTAKKGPNAGQIVAEIELTAGTINLIVYLLNKIAQAVPAAYF